MIDLEIFSKKIEKIALRAMAIKKFWKKQKRNFAELSSNEAKFEFEEKQ